MQVGLVDSLSDGGGQGGVIWTDPSRKPQSYREAPLANLIFILWETLQDGLFWDEHTLGWWRQHGGHRSSLGARHSLPFPGGMEAEA